MVSIDRLGFEGNRLNEIVRMRLHREESSGENMGEYVVVVYHQLISKLTNIFFAGYFYTRFHK